MKIRLMALSVLVCSSLLSLSQPAVAYGGGPWGGDAPWDRFDGPWNSFDGPWNRGGWNRGGDRGGGIGAARGVVMRRGIVLTVRGTVLTARGTGAGGIEAARTGAARGAVMLRGIVLTARGTVLTARGTTVADVAVASAHSTGRHPLSLPGFVTWWGSDWCRFCDDYLVTANG